MCYEETSEEVALKNGAQNYKNREEALNKCRASNKIEPRNIYNIITPIEGRTCDLCDNKFEEKDEYEPCCKLADLVSVNSENMGISTKHHTGRDYIVMPDPYERPRLDPKFEVRPTVELLWFGSQSSFKFLPIVEVCKD